MWTSRNRIVCEKTIINQQSGRMQESVAHIILFSRCLIATNISTASDSTNHTYHVGYFPMFSFVCSFVCWCFLEMGGRRGWGCGIPPHMMRRPPPTPNNNKNQKRASGPSHHEQVGLVQNMRTCKLDLKKHQIKFMAINIIKTRIFYSYLIEGETIHCTHSFAFCGAPATPASFNYL